MDLTVKNCRGVGLRVGTGRDEPALDIASDAGWFRGSSVWTRALLCGGAAP